MSPNPASWARVTARMDRRSKKPGPEAQLQRLVLQYLRAARIGHVVRVNTGQLPAGEHGERIVRFGELGHSDILVELPLDAPAGLGGRNLYIELKAPGNRPTEAQEAFLARQRARGCPAFWVDCLEQLVAQLQALGFVVPRTRRRTA